MYKVIFNVIESFVILKIKAMDMILICYSYNHYV